MVPFANNIQRRIIGWHLFPIKRFELVPLSAHDNCMGTWTTFWQIAHKSNRNNLQQRRWHHGDGHLQRRSRGWCSWWPDPSPGSHYLYLAGLEQQTLQPLLSRDNRQERKTLEKILSGNSKMIQKLEKKISRIPGSPKGKHLTRSQSNPASSHYLFLWNNPGELLSHLLLGHLPRWPWWSWWPWPWWPLPWWPAPWLPTKMTMMTCFLGTRQNKLWTDWSKNWPEWWGDFKRQRW